MDAEAKEHPMPERDGESGRKSVQAKDISDDVFIAAVQRCSLRQAQEWSAVDAWCNRCDVAADLGFPEKVVLAKARAIIKKGRMDGCACGCRGDFDLRGYPDDPFTEAAGSASYAHGTTSAE